ncbi:hypothetical protein [Aureivirga sp. CE67]|uniref:hypothetical protein n=1 Tax=Aureivirga sp. CE67 TaxID=1788983 RepID=UPI0018CBA39B|nr:hypothetical protein [Aureivirga sp. CE67]
MKNIKLFELEELKDKSKFQLIEEGIYIDLSIEEEYTGHLMPIEIDLEKEDGNQYPLEDILDKFCVDIEEEILVDLTNRKMKLLFGGDLEDLQALKSIIGKRVYNETYLSEEGKSLIKLVIE